MTASLTWKAPGNIYAQRGFVCCSKDALSAGGFLPHLPRRYSDHTSWDMVWLRIDWNGHGFDAFVTDDNLEAHAEVSFTLPKTPTAQDSGSTWRSPGTETTAWWLYVNGKLAAKKDAVAVYDTGLDQFELRHARGLPASGAEPL